jgi:hypothetical protein
MRSPPDSRKARVGVPGLESNSAILSRAQLNSRTSLALQERSERRQRQVAHLAPLPDKR